MREGMVCHIGDMFVTMAGDHYVCTTANSWSVISDNSRVIPPVHIVTTHNPLELIIYTFLGFILGTALMWSMKAIYNYLSFRIEND